MRLEQLLKDVTTIGEPLMRISSMWTGDACGLRENPARRNGMGRVRGRKTNENENESGMLRPMSMLTMLMMMMVEVESPSVSVCD